jgi:pseudaminic acid cytidylyltransferase
MTNLAIIPARGGSKRLPRKNIIDFKGRPIICWTIESALKSGVFDEVIVSTEDDEIASIALKCGAKVEYRDESLACDKSSVNEVLLSILNKRKIENQLPDILCCLYATSPLRSSDDIKNTVSLVTEGFCQQSVAVTEFDLPVHQAMQLSNSKVLTPLFPKLINKRESEVGKIVVDNGSTYVATVESFLRTKDLLAEGVLGYVMPRVRSVDIDEINDLKAALFNADLLGIKNIL